MTREEFQEKFAVDGKWMQYPWDCTHPNKFIEEHSHTDGFICHHDDGYWCEHRMKYMEDLMFGKNE